MPGKVKFKIAGLSSKEKAIKLVEAFNFQAGIRVKANSINSELIVYYNKKLWNQQSIKDFLAKLGFQIITKKEQRKREIHSFQLFLTIILSLPIIYTTLILNTNLDYERYLPPLNIAINALLGLGAIILIGIGGYYFKSIIISVKNWRMRSSILLLLASVIIYLYSLFNFIYHYTAITYSNLHHYLMIDFLAILFISYLFSKTMEYKLSESVENYQEALTYFTITKVKAIVEEQIIEKRIEEVEPGDLIIVESEQFVPCNGIIVSGFSYFNRSIINGDSTPVHFKVGEKVLSGVYNLAQEVTIEVVDRYQDSLLSKMVNYVKTSHTLRDVYRDLLNKIYNIYFPLIIIFAILTSLINYFNSNNFDTSVRLLIYILAGGMPAALTLAFPISIIISIDKFNNAGINLKYHQIVPELIKSKAIVFSHVGTLSTGMVRVNNFEITDKFYGDILYSFEMQYSSPITKVVIDYLKLYDYHPNDKIKFENIGNGRLKGTLKNDVYYLASHQFAKTLLEDSQVIDDYHNRFSSDNNILLYLICNNKVVIKIAMADNLKEAASPSIRWLKSMGYLVFIFSNEREVKTLQRVTGLPTENILSGLKPIDKIVKLDEMMEKYKNVTFIGDSLSDAPCILRAHIGISINDGSKESIETSDISTQSDDLTAIPRIIQYCQKINQNIIQNIILSLVYSVILISCIVIFIPNFYLITLFILLGQLIVVMNALRLKETKI